MIRKGCVGVNKTIGIAVGQIFKVDRGGRRKRKERGRLGLRFGYEKIIYCEKRWLNTGSQKIP